MISLSKYIIYLCSIWYLNATSLQSQFQGSFAGDTWYPQQKFLYKINAKLTNKFLLLDKNIDLKSDKRIHYASKIETTGPIGLKKS